MDRADYIRVLEEFEAGDECAKIVKEGIEMILAENRTLRALEESHRLENGVLREEVKAQRETIVSSIKPVKE